MNTKQRPVFLAVTKYRYPIPAIVSVLHRASGVILFLAIPLLLWALQKSLASPEEFQLLSAALGHPVSIAFIWLIVAALLYHLVAGIRHMLMDVGLGESRQAGRATAWTVIVLTIILLAITGIWWWSSLQ